MFITARIAKRAKVMFLLACVTHSVQVSGDVTPNASWDRSHGYRGGGRWSDPGGETSTTPPQTGPPPPRDRTTPYPPTHTPDRTTPPDRKGHWPPPGRKGHWPPMPPPPPDSYRNYGQWTAGTHPTGMHSCFNLVHIGNSVGYLACLSHFKTLQPYGMMKMNFAQCWFLGWTELELSC